MRPLHHLSAIELKNAFLKGEISAKKIAETFLARIEKYDPKLQSFLSVMGPQALLKAESIDRKRALGQPLGKLAAIPIAIKDNMHIEGEITTCASQFLKNYKAPFSATAVQSLEREDAIFLGKTNLDEFAMGSTTSNSSFFPTHNPWDLKCTPGGSSGGSAAAVAARLSLLATGSDTGGSIRQPAALCGIVGFKPTYGRVSRYGLVAFGSSLDQIGPMTTTVADAALAMEVMGHHDFKDATSMDLPAESYLLSKELEPETTLGVPWQFLEGLKPDALRNFKEAVQVMKDLGAKIVEVDLSILKYSIAVYYTLATAEASTNLARFDGIRFGERSKEAKDLEQIYEWSRKEGFGREVKQRIMLGTYVLSAGFQDAYYKKAQKVRTLILDAFESAFNGCDAILMPVSPTASFKADSIHDPIEIYLQDIYTVSANLAGIPAISVPSGYNDEGLPFGLQMLGPQMCDVALMQLAYAYEQATLHAKIPEGYE